LNHIRQAKAAVKIPINASLNGTSLGGWTSYARQMEQAGADALELNIYYIPTDAEQTAEQVEQTYIDILKAVKSAVSIPVALKLGPFFSNMARMARSIDQAGANGLVLFNRFYQPDLDLDTLEVVARLDLSQPWELRLPLRWIAILRPELGPDACLAATSGIGSATDVVKALMVGADVAMMTSAILRHGPDKIRTVEAALRTWMAENEYESVSQLRGSASSTAVEDPSAFERANYMRTLRSWSAPRDLTPA